MKAILRNSVNCVPMSVRTWIKYIPIVASLQRWLVKAVLAGEAFEHTIIGGPANGLRMAIKLPEDKALWTGTFETGFADQLRHGVRTGDVCYDVGSYRGYMAGVMALAGASKVVLFEPLPQNCQGLRRLLEMNHTLPLELQPVAIGNSNGETRFRIAADSSMGKLADSPFQPGYAGEQEIPVTLKTLDALVFDEGLVAPDLIKIDVEGAEELVLRGAARVLREVRPRLFMEIHSGQLEGVCQEILKSAGYTVRRMLAGDKLEHETRHVRAEPI